MREKVGLDTTSLQFKALHKALIKVVLPAPISPLSVITFSLISAMIDWATSSIWSNEYIRSKELVFWRQKYKRD